MGFWPNGVSSFKPEIMASIFISQTMLTDTNRNVCYVYYLWSYNFTKLTQIHFCKKFAELNGHKS